MTDKTNPNHYQFPGDVQVIDITKHLDFMTGNVVKYAARAGRKDGESRLDDQLNCEVIAFHEVEEHMRAIAESADATPKKKSVLELAKENGFDLSRVRDQREIVDAMTGKRMQED